MICDPECKEAAPRIAQPISALSQFTETEMPGIYNQPESQQVQCNQHEREERDDLCQETLRTIGGLTI